MTKFKAGDRVRILDTSRIRQGSKSTIGCRFVLDTDAAGDLNDGFPIEVRSMPGHTFMATDLIIDNPYTSQECTSTSSKLTGESELDRMERMLDEQDNLYPKPSQGQYKPLHTDQRTPAPDVKSMREELKGGPIKSWQLPDYEDDRGIQPILIVRSKKKRRELIVSKLPEGQLIPRR